jgi:putative nucleotidyltransferase with HDIG domain
MLVQDKSTGSLLGVVIASLDKQPLALSAVAQAVITLTTDPRVGLHRLARAVEADVGLSGQIIKRANSAFYASGNRIASVPLAIVKIGFPATRSLAITSSLRAIYRSADEDDIEHTLWQHSLAVGIGARLIAKYVNQRQTEDAYLAGLLHDVAKLILLQRFADHYEPLIQAAPLPDRARLSQESASLGFTHADLGAMILDRWNFAATQIEAVRFHHEPDRLARQKLPGRAGEDAVVLAHAVCLANDIAKAVERRAEAAERAEICHTASADFFDLTAEEILHTCELLEFQMGDELQVFDHQI